MAELSFLWHDYETFGKQARRDRPAQFAAIRTDANLNEVGQAEMFYCQPAPDFVPDPESCLITGITPQICLERGIPEYQFAQRIEALLALPGTIGLGYNTIRFDDEVTRFLFWRNLIDPYAREWQNQCGRWDLLDVVRTTYALRPQGINWPTNAEGKPSFRLEHLTSANGIEQVGAHDALVDVRATIALARLIREQQPRLFDFCLALRDKNRAADEVGLANPRPLLHVSGMYSAERGCIGIVWPLAQHPHNKNEIIVWDLAYDPRELETLDAQRIRERMFTRTEDLAPNQTRLPIKTIHLNKSPVVINQLKTLTPEMADRWQIDTAKCLEHAQYAAQLPSRTNVWREVFARTDITNASVDEDLYGGFINAGDRKQLDQLRKLSPRELASNHPAFSDARLEELLFRYRARNFPDSLTAEERALWEEHRAKRLLEGAEDARTIPALFEQIDQLSETVDETGENILSALYDYAEMIAPGNH